MPEDVTTLLIAWGDGDRAALDNLISKVYDELRRVAGNYLRYERPDHSLQPTALVNEVYLSLVDWKGISWQNRAHFFAVAAQLMRRILAGHARSHLADKRGGGIYKISLDDVPSLPDRRGENLVDLIALDDALVRLAVLNPQQSQIFELRYFGGLSGKDISEVLGISPATVSRQLKLATIFLLHELDILVR